MLQDKWQTNICVDAGLDTIGYFKYNDKVLSKMHMRLPILAAFQKKPRNLWKKR
jgi:hypothetical protein